MSADGFRCVLCCANEARPWLVDCPDSYLQKGAPVDYVECFACSLVQQYPLPEEVASLYMDYPVHASRNTIQRLARRIFHRQVYFHPPAGFQARTLLDYGCGDGTFLREVKERAGEVFGFEPGSDHAGALSERLGVPVYSSTETLCEERAGTVDVITAHFVLEHVPDLRGTFETFRTLLKPGGRLYIAVPNIRSWEARLFGRYWHGLDAPRHLVFPDAAHFRALAAASGFEITQISFAAFPNTLAASLATLLTGRCHPVLLAGFTFPCWLAALVAPSGTRIIGMKTRGDV